MFYAVIELVALSAEMRKQAIEETLAWNGMVQDERAYIPCANYASAKEVARKYEKCYSVA